MLRQVELALAYGCANSVGSEMLLQYIHHNRNHNARRIDTMGNFFKSKQNLKTVIHLKLVLHREVL